MSHKFAFGSVVGAEEIVSTDPIYVKYQDWFYEHFEWGLTGNALKWKPMEGTQVRKYASCSTGVSLNGKQSSFCVYKLKYGQDNYTFWRSGRIAYLYCDLFTPYGHLGPKSVSKTIQTISISPADNCRHNRYHAFYNFECT